MQKLCRSGIWLLCLGFACLARFEARADIRIVAGSGSAYALAQRILVSAKGVSLQAISTPVGRCMDAHQPSPRDIQMVFNADVLLLNGAGLEPFADKLVATNQHLKVIDASRNVELQGRGDVKNPHYWLSLSALANSSRAVAADLQRLYPHLGGSIEDSLRQFSEEIAQREHRQRELAAKLGALPVVTLHPALSYLAVELGFRLVEEISLEEGVVSPAQLRHVVDLLRDHSEAYILADSFLPERIKVSFETDFPGRLVVLDGFLPEPLHAGSLLQTIDHNFAAIEKYLAVLARRGA